MWLIFLYSYFSTPQGSYSNIHINNNGNLLTGIYIGTSGQFYEQSLSTVCVVSSGTNGNRVEYAITGGCTIQTVSFKAVRIA